jgi:HEAT repeat protein
VTGTKRAIAGAAAITVIAAGLLLVGHLRDHGDSDPTSAAPVPAAKAGRPLPAFRPGAAVAPEAEPDSAASRPGDDAEVDAVIDRLVALLDRGRALSPEDRGALEALQAQLLARGAAAVPALIARMDATTTSAGAREVLFQALCQLPGKAAFDRVVATALAGPQPALRTMAIETLGQQRSDEAVRTLAVVARNDPDLPARPLMGRPRDPSDPSTDLPDERRFTPRMQAMAALATVKDATAREVLLEILATGPDESLRIEAARNLGSMFEDRRVAAGLQRAAASDPSGYVRLAALRALARTTDPAWLPELTRIATSDPDTGVRVLAQQLVDRLGQN